MSSATMIFDNADLTVVVVKLWNMLKADDKKRRLTSLANMMVHNPAM